MTEEQLQVIKERAAKKKRDILERKSRAPKLNTLQQEAVDRFWRGQSTILTGRAGTGKSAVIKEIMRMGFNKNLIVTATTNKAAALLGVRTINAALKLTMVDVRDIHGTTKLGSRSMNSPMSPSDVSKADFIVIDEASMISDNVYSALMYQMKLGATILYVGDDGQLPPVGGRNVFKDVLKPVTGVVELTQVYRQKQGGLLEYASSIYKKNPSTTAGILYNFEKKTFVEHYNIQDLPKDLSTRVDTIPTNLQILAPTNKTVALVNIEAIKQNKSPETGYYLWVDHPKGSARIGLKYNTPLIYVGNTTKYFVKNTIYRPTMEYKEDVVKHYEEYFEMAGDLVDYKPKLRSNNMKSIYHYAFSQGDKITNKYNKIAHPTDDMTERVKDLKDLLAPIPKISAINNKTPEQKIKENKQLDDQLKTFSDDITYYTTRNKKNRERVIEVSKLLKTLGDIGYPSKIPLYILIKSKVWQTVISGQTDDVLQSYCLAAMNPKKPESYMKLLSELLVQCAYVELTSEQHPKEWKKLNKLLDNTIINPFSDFIATIRIPDTFNEDGVDVIFNKTRKLIPGTKEYRLSVNEENGYSEIDGGHLVINGSYVSQYDLADLFKPAYCLTVHKSQGSQYDNVAIVLASRGDVSNMWNSLHGLEYTAITRSQNNVILFTTPETRPYLRKKGKYD